MPQKLNRAGKMQDYIPAGNGDPSGEYGTAKGTNKNFTTADKKKETKANVISENKSVAVENKGKSLKEKMNENAKTYKEENYNGHAIMPDLLDGYTVDYEGEEVWFKTKDEAKAFIDKELGIKDNKANVIDGDLTGKKEETRDYDSITYPKGTSKEYTIKVDKEYKEALPILKEYGIDIKEFGSWEDKDAFADKFEEITNKYVFDRFKQEKDQSNKAWKDKGYQRLVDALEKVEDKQYNDWWIKNKK